MTRAFLFDFDNTLAATDVYKEHRRKAGYEFNNRAWQTYFAQVQDAPPVVNTVGEPVADIAYRLIESGVPTAIVTTSPRQVPIAWFQHHYGIVPPAIVGFQDSPKRKPDPAPYFAALRQLRIPPSQNVISVGDNWRDVAAADAAGITSASFMNWAIRSAAPDVFYASDIDEPAMLATHYPDANDVFSIYESDGWEDDGDIWRVGGRYHPRRSEGSGGTVHDLIVESKTGTWAPALVDSATRLVAAEMHLPADLILTTIPPHEGPDRFESIRTEVARRLGIRSAPLLRWTREVGSLRHAGGPATRRRMVSGALCCDSVADEWIVVLDDVYTTGATTNEAVRAIRSAGGLGIPVALVATLTRSPHVNLDIEDWGHVDPLPTAAGARALRANAKEQQKQARIEQERRQRIAQAQEAERRKEQKQLQNLKNAQETKLREERNRKQKIADEKNRERRKEEQRRQRIARQVCRDPNHRIEHHNLEAAWIAQVENVKNGRNRWVEKCGNHYHLTATDPKQPALQITTSTRPPAGRFRSELSKAQRTALERLGGPFPID